MPSRVGLSLWPASLIAWLSLSAASSALEGCAPASGRLELAGSGQRAPKQAPDGDGGGGGGGGGLALAADSAAGQQLARWAPYAVESDYIRLSVASRGDTEPPADGHNVSNEKRTKGLQLGGAATGARNNNMRNIIFRLAANLSGDPLAAGSSGTESDSSPAPSANQMSQLELSGAGAEADEAWPTFVTKNGTLVGIRANLNLRKLLDALDYNNYTSEVRFENNDPSLINVTISNFQDTDKIDSLLLEKLLSETNNLPALPAASSSSSSSSASGAAAPGSQESGLQLGASAAGSTHPDGLQLTGSEEKRQLVKVGRLPGALAAGGEPTSMTSPPIRVAFEANLENYTMRKVADEANVFALNLLNQLNVEKLGDRNLIQAPFAVYQGLSLLLNGAMGDTSKELDRALLGSQSVYDSGKFIHDQERPRLLASFSDSIRQLQLSATHHFRIPLVARPPLAAKPTNGSGPDGERVALGGGGGANAFDEATGGTLEQHLIVANNLLFSPAAYEISPDFTSLLNTYYNNTVLTKIEIGSTESVQLINSWIRAATKGVVPSILNKKSTFDEFNVMALLCTSWLAQEWRDTFYRVSSSLRTSVRLKGQTGRSGASARAAFAGNLLEFEDDNKRSHFVDYIKSRPSENIQHYHSSINGMLVDMVSVPLKHSNHRFIALTPIAIQNASQQQSLDSIAYGGEQQQQALLPAFVPQHSNSSAANHSSSNLDLPDSSLLSKLILNIKTNPRKALRNLWNIVAPDLITKQTLLDLLEARPKNITVDERVVETNSPVRVQLSMPIIRSEADSSITAALNLMGIVNAFDPNQANFIGINGHPFNYYKLHLSNVISKTTFNINERGINYDKTIKTLESLRIFPNRKQQQQQQQGAYLREDDDDNDSGPIKPDDIIDEVKLSKPFMYLVCDVRTKLVLYTGIVRNPEQEGP